MANWNVLYVTNEIWHDAPEMFTSSYFKILKKNYFSSTILLLLTSKNLENEEYKIY